MQITLKPDRIDYYETELVDIHAELIGCELSQKNLTGNGIRIDGEWMQPDDLVKLNAATPVSFSMVDFAHLFGVFNNSRVTLLAGSRHGSRPRLQRVSRLLLPQQNPVLHQDDVSRFSGRKHTQIRIAT